MAIPVQLAAIHVRLVEGQPPPEDPVKNQTIPENPVESQPPAENSTDAASSEDEDLLWGVQMMNKLELFLPLWSGDEWEYHRYLERSLSLFWADAKLLIILETDKETEKETGANFATQLGSQGYVQVNVANDVPPQNSKLARWDRQNLRMFQADTWADSEFVGFVDADTIFITSVDAEDIFDREGKPYVIAEVGAPTGDRIFTSIPQATEWATGEPEVMKCTSYFPIVIKRAHLAEMRSYFEVFHSESFESFFANLAAFQHGVYSHFNIMCNWLYKFKYDEYHWRLHQTDPDWSGHVAGQIPIDTYRQIVTKEDVRPIVRVARHGRKDGIISDVDISIALGQGYCKSLLDDRPDFCMFPRVHVGLFVFESVSWLWDQDGCIKAQQEHYDRVKAYERAFNQGVVDFISSKITHRNQEQESDALLAGSVAANGCFTPFRKNTTNSTQ